MVLSIVNQKGGTGKTTTTINLGKALTQMGYHVMLVDMDPQGNLSYSLAITEFDQSLSDLLTNSNLTIEDIVIEREGMHVLPTDASLAYDELQGKINSAFLLKDKLAGADEYDLILIDCPPTLSILTINALTASNHVLVPMQLDVFSMQGLKQIIQTIDDLKVNYNSKLQIIGVLPVMVDYRKKLTNEVLEHVKSEFNLYVFNTHIRTNVKAAEAPSFGSSVITYAPNANSTKDYKAAAEELVKRYE